MGEADVIRFTASPGTTSAKPPEASGGTDRGRCIALLLESDGPGGAEYMLLHLAEELRTGAATTEGVLPGTVA